MDPSRIQLEDDRYGLIGVSFRPRNRATFLGADDGDFVWSVGIVVGEEDEIQTVEIDEHGAKSSRMLTPGELFQGLEILGRPGPEAYLIVGAVTLLGLELRASNPETARQFADLLRAAADDRSWRLPLHLIGQPRDLQLSAQGREILKQTATALEREGEARTSLSAAQRLELSGSALDSIRRRISRKSLQAYRMHGRWYVVLDNLTRSRASEQNGTHAAAAPAAPTPAPTVSPFEEMPGATAEPEPAPAETPEPEESYVTAEEGPVDVAEGVISLDESEPAPAEEVAADEGEHPTEEVLAAFEAEEPEAEQVAEAESIESATLGEPEQQVAADEALESEAAAEEQAARDELARDVGALPPPAPSVEHEAEAAAEEEEASSEMMPQAVDQLISETVMEQFVVAEIDTLVRELHPAEEQAEETETEGAAEAEQAEEIGAAEVAGETAESEPEAESEFQLTSEPEAESEEGEEQIILTAEQDAVSAEAEIGREEVTAEGEPEFAAEAEGAEGESELAAEAEPAEGELEAATEEAFDASVEGESAEPEAESVVSEMTRAATEAEPETLAEEPSEENGEPVPEMTQSQEEAEVESSPLEAETAQAVEEPTAPEAEIEPEVAEGEAPQPEEVVAAGPEEIPQAEVPEIEETVETAEPESAGPTAAAEEAYEAEPGETGYVPEEEPRQRRADGAAELLGHLQSEVAFLRQQGQEKDRQIVAWISGGQWLQPFVDQIHSLEQQVERLGELQAQRDTDRIADLVTERDRLRERLVQLESEIEAARATTETPTTRRSWFRRMMGSD